MMNTMLVTGEAREEAVEGEAASLFVNPNLAYPEFVASVLTLRIVDSPDEGDDDPAPSSSSRQTKRARGQSSGVSQGDPEIVIGEVSSLPSSEFMLMGDTGLRTFSAPIPEDHSPSFVPSNTTHVPVSQVRKILRTLIGMKDAVANQSSKLVQSLKEKLACAETEAREARAEARRLRRELAEARRSRGAQSASSSRRNLVLDDSGDEEIESGEDEAGSSGENDV